MEALIDEDMPAIELLPSETVCPTCHYTYHRHQPACTASCKSDW